MGVMFLIVFVNATRRYTLGKSFEWGEELPVYLAIYGVMFGIALAYLEDRHVRLAIIVDQLPAQIRHWLFVVVDLIMVCAGALLAWSGWLFASKRGGIESSGLIGGAKDIADYTGLSFIAFFGQMYFWQSALCLGGMMMSIAALLKFLERINGLTDEHQKQMGGL